AWVDWYFPGLAEYVGVLAGAGLEVTFAHLFPRPTPLDGSDGLREWLLTFRPGLESRLGDAWTSFARDVEARCSPALQTERGWSLDYVRLRVVAARPASPARKGDEGPVSA